MSTELFNHADRSGFIERLGALSGKTTYREPGGAGHQPFVATSISTDNAMVLALSMARRGKFDVGPDMAYTIGTGQPHQRERVVSWLAARLLHDTGPAGRKCQGHLNILAAHCYEMVGYGHAVSRLPRRLPMAWDKLRDIGVGWLWMSAEASIERAERALHGRADPGRCVADEIA